MATTPNMGLQVPDDHTSLDTWGLALNTAFGVSGGGIDAHDHSPGKGVLVPSAGIGINADLSFATFALTTAKAVTFNPVALSAVTGYASALFVNAANNNLYFRNNSGTNVQLTNGGTINMSLIGGIGGDYASVNALVQYNDSSKDYLLQQEGSPRPWAGLETGDIKLFQKAASIANAVTLKSPSALAASYTVTWLAALPASAMGLAIDSTGQMTAGASFAMLANANITLSGTGTYKHGTKSINRPIRTADCYATSGSIGSNPPGGTLGATSTVYIPLPDLPRHARLTGVRLYYGSAANAAACLAKLYSTSDAVPCVGGFTDLLTTLTPGGTSIASTTGLTFQYTNAGSYWIQVTNSTGGERVSAVGIDYDVP